MDDMSRINILEVFYSIQGEGKYLGYPQLFIRLAKCIFDCPYCDTLKTNSKNFSFDNGLNYFENPIEVNDLKRLIDEKYYSILNSIHSISFTGGEPLLQKDSLKELAMLFNRDNRRLFLETSGFLYDELLEVGDIFDIISIDLKSHNEKAIQNMHTLLNACKKLTKSDIYFKLPLIQGFDLEIVKNIFEMLYKNQFKAIYLQPIDNKIDKEHVMKIFKLNEEYALDLRLSAQVHKIWNLL